MLQYTGSASCRRLIGKARGYRRLPIASTPSPSDTAQPDGVAGLAEARDARRRLRAASGGARAGAEPYTHQVTSGKDRFNEASAGSEQMDTPPPFTARIPDADAAGVAHGAGTGGGNEPLFQPSSQGAWTGAMARWLDAVRSAPGERDHSSARVITLLSCIYLQLPVSRLDP
jgi:hypothetical protein